LNRPGFRKSVGLRVTYWRESRGLGLISSCRVIVSADVIGQRGTAEGGVEVAGRVIGKRRVPDTGVAAATGNQVKRADADGRVFASVYVAKQSEDADSCIVIADRIRVERLPSHGCVIDSVPRNGWKTDERVVTFGSVGAGVTPGGSPRHEPRGDSPKEAMARPSVKRGRSL
jgi:hypothetical protein